VPDIRKESDGYAVVEGPADKLWSVHTYGSIQLTVRRSVKK